MNQPKQSTLLSQINSNVVWAFILVIALICFLLLTSCGKEAPEPNHQGAGPIQCDTCVIEPYSLDTSFLFNMWWVHYENGFVGAAFCFTQSSNQDIYIYTGSVRACVHEKRTQMGAAY
jgi:hypothetical protein